MLYANNQVDKFSKKDISDSQENTYKNQEMNDFGFYIQKGLFEECRCFQFRRSKAMVEQVLNLRYL